MYLQYLPNRHVETIFPGTWSGFTDPHLDAQGMIPYTGKPLGFAQGSADIPTSTQQAIAAEPLPARRQKTLITLEDETISLVPIVSELLKHCARKPFYQEIQFTLKDLFSLARIEAVIYAGTLSCLIKPSTDELRRNLLRRRREAMRELYQKTNFSISLDIADEIRTGKL